MEGKTMTGADLIVRRLHDHGVRQVFGYPGGQLTPLYDALARDGHIRHILARDEQAAAFMADGFARATGRPGVCLAVCGPGVNNAVTPLATAFTDSIPFLLISGQIPQAGRGLRSGYYHENDQLILCATCIRAGIRVETADEIPSALDRAFRAMTEARPGPVLIEIPVDLQRAETSLPWPTAPLPAESKRPSARDVEGLAKMLSGWKRPLLLAGGGVASASAEPALRMLAERLGAPVFHTAMGKCALPSDHPLAAGMPWSRATSDLSAMEQFFSPLFAEADGVLALGCRFTQLTTGTWTLKLPVLAQIDIDPDEVGRHYPLALGIHGDARLTLEQLLKLLPAAPRPSWAHPRRTEDLWQLPGLDLVTPFRRALPRDGILVADITRLAYILMVEFPVYQSRTFLHPAGYVSMGYAIPAALGARTAFPGRPIVAVVGDGCFLMSGMELATAVQEKLPIVVILINDGSLTLIKAIQKRRYQERYLGVDLLNPDFGLFARAFGVRHQAVSDAPSFEAALRDALGRDETTLLEVQIH
jgi:acetolactate synthase-1/2/3 large subunit